MQLEIDKLGGTSVDNMQQSGRVVAGNREPGKALLVITSARSGVTSALQGTIRVAVKRGVTEESFSGMTYAEQIRYRERDDEPDIPHYWIVLRNNAEQCHEYIDKNVDPKEAESLHRIVDDRTIEALGDIATMSRTKTLVPAVRDRHCALLGEYIASLTFAAHLRCSGIDAVYYEAAQIMVTDSNFGNAKPSIAGTKERSRESGLISDLMGGKVVVLGGYYGSDKDGRITTFSRGGSDFSATAMGRVLTPLFDPIKVCLYKAAVAGVMSADPRIVANPHIVPHMLYEEAAALTALGGGVIHPKAVHQAVRSGSAKRPPFPIYIKSTINPESPGTVIDNKEDPKYEPVKAISLIRNAVSLEVRGWGMDRPGIMRKITGVLAEKGVDIDFITQPHSKLALSLAFQYAGEEIDLEKAIREGLADEIKGNDVDMVKAMRVGVIGVIGKGLSDPRILGKVIAGMNGDFPELRSPNAYKLTTGEFEASILVDLPEERLEKLVQSIHDSVFRREIE